MARRKKKSNGALRFFVWTFAILLILGLAGFLGGYLWVQGYLHSPAFRQMLAKRFGAVSHTNVEIADLSWTGSTLYMPKVGISPAIAGGWKRLEADGLQASLDMSTWRQGVWTVPQVDMDLLRLELAPPAAVGAPPVEIEAGGPADDVSTDNIPGWLRGWIPQRTEISSVNVQSFELLPPQGSGGAEVSGMRLNAKPATGETTWLLRGEGGTLRLPAVTDTFKITSASASVDGRNLALNDSLLRWIGDSEVTARGDLPFDKSKGWKFNGRYANLDLRFVVSHDWQGRISGVLEGDFDASSQQPTPVLFKTKAKIKNGVLQSLPLLDRIADFSRTDRFRRVVLDEASGDVEHQGDITKITSLVLQSNGLVRLEGDVTIQGRNVNGSFHVGVFPETLRWIPGAQGHVFTEQRPSGPPGFVWTTLRVTGTIDDPREDLSNRLLAAAGKALLLDAPMSILGKTTDIIGNPGNAGKSVIDGGKDLIQGTGDAVGKGLDTAKDLLTVPFLKK